MPIYSQIKIRSGDTDALKAKKKRVAENIRKLKSTLLNKFKDTQTNPTECESVKIATWNIREFGGTSFGGRDFEAIYYICEIISHFDIVALQEVRGDLDEFMRMKAILGDNWDFIATDVTDGDAGNGERMVFLFDRRNIRFRNIAGELTLKEGGKIRAAFGERIKLENGLRVDLPAGAQNLSGEYPARLKTSGGTKKLDRDVEIPLPANSVLRIPDGSSLVVSKGTPVTSPGRGKAQIDIPATIEGERLRLRFPPDTFDDSLRQFARTPFLISFQAGWLKINLCTVHIYFGDEDDDQKLEQRRKEIEMLTESLAAKAKGEFKNDDKAFLGVLGDFNIASSDHPTMAALESNDFLVPEELKSIPGSNVAQDKTYDQIAFWKPSRISGYARLDILSAGVFDYFEQVFRDEDEALYRDEGGNGLKPTTSFSRWRTYKMSDHLPMWIELRTDFSEEYLKMIVDS